MSTDLHARWFLALVVLLAVGSSVAVASNHEVTVDSFSYSGEGAVSTSDDRLQLWEAEPHAFDVVIATGNASGTYDVCLESRPVDASEPTELVCQATTIDADGQTELSLELDRWPANATGRQNVSVVVTDPNGSDPAPLARETIGVTVLAKDADPDEDGLTNEREAAAGTSFFAADTDRDGLSDGIEVDTYGTDPTQADTDGDELVDGPEANAHQTDPTQADTDGDGLTDDLEVDEYGTNPNRADTDGDGLSDAAEVNTYGTNPNEADTDEDGLGDAAEVNTHETNPNVVDTDEDGLTDGEEVSVYGTNPTNADTDGDGLADREEVDTHQTDPTDADTDGDGLDDGAEIAEHGTNPNRADTDGDGLDDGEELEAGTDPTVPDAEEAADDALVPREVIGGLFLVAGLALLVVFAFVRRSGIREVVARIRRVGTTPSTEDDSADEEPSEPVDLAAGHAPIPTNRGRVMELLEERGGRMLQSDIVEQTDWSKSKVSRVLSDMDEDGEVAKIDVGKGNLIALPEVAPQISRPRSERDEE